MPEISVIMGVYGQNSDTSMLKRSVQSILTQSYRDFEFLICDDGSCQEVRTVLDNIAFEDSRIKLLREGEKYTLPQKLNYCLKFSVGRYVARMDDDDYSLPERFERQLQVLIKHPEISFVGSNVNLLRNGLFVGERFLPPFPTKEDFLFVQPYIHPTLMFRKTAMDSVKGYSERSKQILCEDYDLLLRLYEKGFTGSNIQEVLLHYTIPSKGKDKRRIKHRINEVVTRWERFRALDLLPGAFPYVLKPLVVGLIPAKIRTEIKDRRNQKM